MLREHLERIHRDERGVALVMAIFIALVVMLLSIYVLGQAVHNQQQAAYDRKRLTAQNGAEAGLNWWFNEIQNNGTDTMQLSAHTGSVISGPNSVSFTATPTFYSDLAGTTVFSGTPSANDYPHSVKIVSVGTASDGTQRTMETFLQLNPVYGGFDGALISNSNTTFTNNFTVTGNAGNDGDIVILNGNFNAPSGLQTVKGSIYVGTPTYSAFIGTQLHVYGSVWATGGVTLQHPQALIDLDAKSTYAGVTVNSGNVSGSAYYCTGTAPSASKVAGSRIQTCNLGDPPTTSFPHVTFQGSTWVDSGYWVKNFYDSGSLTACAQATAYVESTGTDRYSIDAAAHPGGIVVRINSNCTYTNTSNVTVSLPVNLAIVTDGGINLTQRSNWNGASGTKNLYFIHAWPSSGTYACAAGNPNGNYDLGDVYLANLTTFDTHVQTSVYTPCEAIMLNNNSAFQGQVISTSMTIGNLFNMAYRPVLIPGAHVTGFKEDVAYIREAQNA